MVLALDWNKTFDSINPDALLMGLRRFGLPEHVLNDIASIYKDRTFQLRDCGQLSSTRQQHSGISQGCPLSPFLSVMMMSALMKDAVARLGARDQELLSTRRLAELLYADDTLLLGVSANSSESCLAAVNAEGGKCGLELHWGKLQLMQIRCNEQAQRLDGTVITPQSDLVYLGIAIADDGRVGRELARRLGMANSEFRRLSSIWRHTSLGKKRKTQIFNAIITPKLLYSLATVCLSIAEKRRLDGFQNRCLRQIWGIKRAFISRVRNDSVLQTSQQRLFSNMVVEQQLLLFGKSLVRRGKVCSDPLCSKAEFPHQCGLLRTDIYGKEADRVWNGLRSFILKLLRQPVAKKAYAKQYCRLFVGSMWRADL